MLRSRNAYMRFQHYFLIVKYIHMMTEAHIKMHIAGKNHTYQLKTKINNIRCRLTMECYMGNF